MKTLRIISWLIVLGILSTAQGLMALEKDQFGTTPRLNNGQKWRVGYYEGGYDANYYNYLAATIKGLMELGWIEKGEIPETKGRETKPVWDWLSKDAKSQYIQFCFGAHQS